MNLGSEPPLQLRAQKKKKRGQSMKYGPSGSSAMGVYFVHNHPSIQLGLLNRQPKLPRRALWSFAIPGVSSKSRPEYGYRLDFFFFFSILFVNQLIQWNQTTSETTLALHPDADHLAIRTKLGMQMSIRFSNYLEVMTCEKPDLDLF